MSNVIFPDEYEADPSRYDDYGYVSDQTAKQMKRCPREGDIYCENVDHYPGDLIADLMNQKENQQLLNKSVIENSLRLASRMHNRGKIRLCRSRSAVIYPRLAFTSK